ncbi:hypothetical protein [Aquibacillus kalidii]|uniref:hypothetical protein n=1 Tax=Aquibacillus kalidii TaxID=2762597 RepID=UPI0016497298|nr:hypothetical protein [Aquibacillus kalidii]
MKRKKVQQNFFLWMLVIALSLLLLVMSVFLHPSYNQQPSMPDMPSMAMMMLLEQTRMSEFNWDSMIDACDYLFGEGFRHHSMPQHGNPVLDPLNIILSVIIILCSVVYFGGLLVFLLLKVPISSRSRTITNNILSLTPLTIAIFVTLACVSFLSVDNFGQKLQSLDAVFWMFTFLSFMILLIFVILVIGSITYLLRGLKQRLNPGKKNKRKRKG